MDRRLYVDQNCRHIQKGQKVTVTGYPIKKPGSNNQTCVKIETDGEAPPPAVANATARSNGAKSVQNTMDVWKEKYRLTMSNLLSAAIQSGKEVDYDQIDGFVRKILDAKYEGEEAPF
jgi:DNA-directed RNA polymerase subunit L